MTARTTWALSAPRGWTGRAHASWSLYRCIILAHGYKLTLETGVQRANSILHSRHARSLPHNRPPRPYVPLLRPDTTDSDPTPYCRRSAPHKVQNTRCWKRAWSHEQPRRSEGQDEYEFADGWKCCDGHGGNRELEACLRDCEDKAVRGKVEGIGSRGVGAKCSWTGGKFGSDCCAMRQRGDTLRA